MKAFAVALLGLAVWGFVGSGVAQEQPPRFEADCFSERDGDGNGRVTLLEARAAELVLFEHLDRDRDGQVTPAEARARAPSWREGRFEVRFAALDRDRDGGLSPWEIAVPSKRFERADRDRDRRLSRAESRALFGGAPGAPRDTTALRATFWRRDLDRNGRVTRQEALAVADRRFMKADRDGDGLLTREEHQAGRRGRAAR